MCWVGLFVCMLALSLGTGYGYHRRTFTIDEQWFEGQPSNFGEIGTNPDHLATQF